MKKITISSIAKAKCAHPKLKIRTCLRRHKISASCFYFKSSADVNARDERSVEPIRLLFAERKERVGIRQLQMLLQNRFDLRMNRKKIARLKNKFGLVTKIRRKSRYKTSAMTYIAHQACKNVLNRNFLVDKPDCVYSTDITEIKFANGERRAYLTAFKDLATNEIVASEIGLHATVDLVISALLKATNQLTPEKRTQLLIHSDQGSQFTHYAYRTQLKKQSITQSMSRRGNCLDNAPIESFFGHLKDHLETTHIKKFDELKKHVTDEINYYNRDRPQLRLNKMPPVVYRRHLEALF